MTAAQETDRLWRGSVEPFSEEPGAIFIKTRLIFPQSGKKVSISMGNEVNLYIILI